MIKIGDGIMSDDILLDVRNLTVHYRTKSGPVHAVENVTFKVRKGESIGFAGESGCGKTTLASAILRILPSNAEIVEGEIWFDGQNILELSQSEFRRHILWKRISMIFQGAMNALNPIIKIGEQIEEAITLHEDVSPREAWQRGADLFQMVGIEPSRINNYPFEFSGGMRQRAMIAMALACRPDLVLADEPTTALDVTIQAQIMELLRELQETLGMSLILITHDISVIAETCDKSAIFYAGNLVEFGPVEKIFLEPMHPYTRGLIESIPSIENAETKRLTSIPGSPPDLLNPPPGCRFHPRCPWATDLCKEKVPALHQVGPDHYAACHYTTEGGFNPPG